MMASSVDRRIERYLPEDMGHCDPGSLIRPRSTDPIRACGQCRAIQAGHMTASDVRCGYAKNPCKPGAIHTCPRAAQSADPWARNDRIVLASCARAGAADPPWMKRLSRRRPGPTYPQLVLPKDGPRLSPGKRSIIRAVTNALFLAMSAATKQSCTAAQGPMRPHLSSHTAAKSWLR